MGGSSLLSFERYTAAGFHMLRGVESEIRDYVFLVSHAQPKKRDWGYYVEFLTDNGADKKLMANLDSIRNLDRNPLMHPEDILDQQEAIAIFSSCLIAIERLISDMDKKGLLLMVKNEKEI